MEIVGSTVKELSAQVTIPAMCVAPPVIPSATRNLSWVGELRRRYFESVSLVRD